MQERSNSSALTQPYGQPRLKRLSWGCWADIITIIFGFCDGTWAFYLHGSRAYLHQQSKNVYSGLGGSKRLHWGRCSRSVLLKCLMMFVYVERETDPGPCMCINSAGAMCSVLWCMLRVVMATTDSTDFLLQLLLLPIELTIDSYHFFYWF